MHYNITTTVNCDSKTILFRLFYRQESHTYLMVFNFKSKLTVAVKMDKDIADSLTVLKTCHWAATAPPSAIELLLSTSYSFFNTADEKTIRKDIADSLREYRHFH